MAAVDPSESPKRLESPAEEEVTCGKKTEAEELVCRLNQKDGICVNKTTESTDEVQRTSPGNDGGCTASHSEVSVESGAAGADQTTCNSPTKPPTTGEKHTEAPGSDHRDFDWSETEDNNEEALKQKQENDMCDLSNVTESAEEVQQDTHVDDEATDDAEETHDEEEEANSHSDAKHTKMQPETEGPVGQVDGIEDAAAAAAEDEEEEGKKKGEKGADIIVKPKKCRLVCKECGKRFTRRETFNLHRHFHAHEDELTPLTCKECGLTFQHRSSLIKHRNEHKEKEEQLLVPKKEVQTMEAGSFECAECERIFSTVGKLRDHNCVNAVEKPYHCPLCRQEFQFKVSVTKHMMTHSQESNFTCQECSQTFPNATALRFHQRCHTALKPYECPECGMVFKHYSVMEDHRRKHTDNTRSHLCNICGKTFKYSSLLHQHQYLHTGQKPFRCPECGKTFAFAQNMKAHCRQHRRLENNCPSEQTYLAPANLRAHMLVHEAEYEKLDRTPRPPTEVNKVWDKGLACPHCPGVFRDESALNVHLGPHPLHSVAVGALPRPPHPNIFFTPQAVMSERPHLAQTLSLPQLAPRTEPHKLGPRLPFAPERLLQCMICGCSLPRELDLQMHYLQHAQGEI
ncbi:zinc finger protein 345 isoform X4 [Notolabrus celidotus]|uniref:zinc finger protein 345 isoform X4 n=1 Tax=Notolabrus celidotus TaxID=1203425 RepID=UPI00148F6DAE|nr:zinc finger protein 345 isoform X4 [Notolabrus celidotus]